MNDHYFTAAPTSPSDPRVRRVEALGLTMDFETDSGVFSKDGLDEGTRLLLENLPACGGRFLDLGCGWGPLGAFFAAKNPGANALLTDVNERAVALSQKNLARNRVANARALVSDGFAAIEGTFDLIATNPPIRAGKQVIYPLFDEAFARLRAQGALFVVIRKQQGAESAKRHLEELGSTALIDKHKGFWILRLGKDENT